MKNFCTKHSTFVFLPPMHGVIAIHKPSGITSRTALDYVQRLVRPEKAGHAGTLDPIASGVLVVCIGPITRLIERIQELPKQYIADFEFGVTSPSDDTETEFTAIPNAPIPTRAQLEEALPDFLGTIQQVPPIFSAVKVDGRRAYDLARRQQEMSLTARPVDIHRLRILDYAYPRLRLEIGCGSGTYIRSLGRDLASQLGTGAIMTGLVRTQIGSLTLDLAVDPKSLTLESLERLILPAPTLFPNIPQVTLNEVEHGAVLKGRSLGNLLYARLPAKSTQAKNPREAFALRPDGTLLALLEYEIEQGWLPRMVFPLPREPTN
jgi:tRNA pseudouridine55 synthase